jgi:transmembrane sensor
MQSTAANSIEEAAHWLMRLSEGALNQEETREFEAWKQRPENQRAWHNAQTLMGHFHELPPHLASPVLKRPRHMERRRFLSWVLCLGGSAALLAGYKSPISTRLLSDVATAKGEQTRLDLPGAGNTLTLNTDTAVNLTNVNLVQQIDLLRGEVWLSLTTDLMTRLSTDQCQLNITQGVVCVYAKGDSTEITLESGSLTLTDTQQNTQTVSAPARIRIDSTGAITDNIATYVDWRDGMLAVHEMPLAEFIQEVSRYRPGVIQLTPDIQSRRISGAYPIHKPQQLLEMLAQAYQLTIEQHLNGYWVQIS